MPSTMPSVMACLLFASGIVLLLHSGYSAIDHFAYLKTIGKQETQLPLDIILEVLVSILIFTQGAVMVAGDLKPIALEIELSRKSMDWVDSTPGFKIVNHRGSALFA
ncbi:hypothetical protein BASA50_004030 [Batrachochytrium salamandrivorans]|uniref:Membrane magnesium transporter n=1 Tax=Batrachochytrium salamandrivorans TaxID=1357716 RepID=A0ABQ8FI89_9FUNG|nr:hypothetical protein BASA60_010467 [Batrachochytrium salamandrivorans]KAH6573564.1 hypothetical protein BASA62_002902 [Batrachochytrium salamandrivorans]KAH6598148.1 hypothetical protein BASA50_004030 [Batrachochytrium salamandrivorans]KAH6601924.1 hypothetical protein BASA61_001627 [Batrachochytrium salamandrivorans]KAH9272416.1 hypothetical protein BASA83_005223 [Batrachochytrium salamandrivorans]